MTNHEESIQVLQWRVKAMEENVTKLTRDVSVLNKAMYMMVGALTLVQVVLPLMEKFSG